MVNNNTDNASAAGGAKSNRQPTLKQRRFANAWADPNGANGNGTEAARRAEYKGDANQLGVQASANLRNPRVLQLISEMVDSSMTELARQRLREALDATTQRAFLNKEGVVVYAEPMADHRVRLGAFDRVLDLLEKSAAVTPAEDVAGEGGEDLPAADQINASDQALCEQATVIDAELANLDAVLDDGLDGHADGDNDDKE